MGGFLGCADGTAQGGEGGDDTGPGVGQFVFGEGAFGGLKGGSDEEGVVGVGDGEALAVAKDLGGFKGL